jgi:hypothetical protein
LLGFRQVDRRLDGRELAQALLVLRRRIRVGDDARTGLQVCDAVAQDDRPDRDARIERRSSGSA